MITLTLPYPPTANNIHTVARGRKIKSQRYRDWATEAFWHATGKGSLSGPYRFTMEVSRPDLRKRDLSNLLKPVEDLLVACGVVRDDSDAQSITLRWSDKAPAKPATVSVTLEPC